MGTCVYERLGSGLQLLDSEQLEYAFAVHGISRETQARNVYAEIWALIQKAEKIRDPVTLGKIEGDLRHLCNDYFSIMHAWQEEEEDRHEGVEACDASKDNMREAQSMIAAFEKNFVRYSICYLELNRALIQVRASLSHLARDYDMTGAAKGIQVNHATGALLQQAHRERKGIMEKRLRLDRVRTLLQHFDPLMELLGEDLPRLLGQEAGGRDLVLFKGALRKKNFDAARAICSRWHHDWLRKTGQTVVDMAEKNASELQAADGIMLHSGELTLITSFLQSDEAKINQLMNKYNVPYMVFKYQNLIHQGYHLGRIGSLEGLIIQHAKLISLSARPVADADTAKMQEQSVLNPARALQNRFKSLASIFDEMETTLSILEKLFSQTREYHNSVCG